MKNRPQTIDRSPQIHLQGMGSERMSYFASYASRLPRLSSLATLLILSLLLSSCFKEKPIAPPHIITNGVYVAHMGDNYTKQLYFNIETGTFVDSNSKYDYDMAFDCGYTYNVWVNGANLSLVCRTGRTDLSAVTFADTVKGWHIEYGAGIPDSNAIGSWQTGLVSNKQVYIINRGVDSNGNSLGFVKMQMGDFTDNSYALTYCNMDNSNMRTAVVPKVANKNLVFLSFNDNAVHDFEPDNTNWDFIFTQYSIFFGPPNNIPYKVTGVLTNPAQTYAYFMDSTSNFDSIKASNVVSAKFNTMTRDNIGYTWKHFTFAGSTYSTNERYNYIIKSGNGQLYKMRFLQFYDAQGEKGYPQFQVYKLQ